MARLTADEARARLVSSLTPTTTKRMARSQESTLELSFTDERQNVFGFRNGGNVLFATADSNLPNIVGESESASDDMPPALLQWLDMLSEEVEWAINEGYVLPSIDSLVADNGRESVSPLIKTKWSQFAPYNDNIIIDGVKCATGCCATATAQVVCMWGRDEHLHRGCMATPAYKTTTTKAKVEALPPITVFDFGNMPNGTPKTDAEKNAVATLMEYCGKGIYSDYGKKSTPAWFSKIYYLLRDYMRMGKVGMIYSTQVSAAYFEERIYKELTSGRPVILSGSKSSGGGHCFIVDGYNATTGKYHFNFGWGGQYDGWFPLSAINVTDKIAYNSNKIAIVNIQSSVLGDVDGDGKVTIQDAMEVVKTAANGTYSERSDVNSDGTVSVDDVNKIANHILGKEEL